MNFKQYSEAMMEIPSILYHATFAANLEVIKHYGLRPCDEVDIVCYPGSENGVYLATDPEFAESFLDATENENIPEDWYGNHVIFEVNTLQLDKNKFDPDPHIAWSDEYVPHSKSYIYRGTIPPSSIYEL